LSIKVQWWAHKGRYYIVVHHERRRYTKAIGIDLEAANRAAEELEIALKLYGNQGLIDFFREPEKREPVTVKKYAEKWMGELDSSDLRENTRLCYKHNMEHHVLTTFGEVELTDVTYSDVKAWILSKAAEKYSKDSCRLMVAAGRSMFQEAMLEGLISGNPFVGLSRFYRAAEREDPDPFSREEWGKVEAYFSANYQDYLALVRFMSGTGVRVGEALGLKWGDIDWEAGRIRIKRTLTINRTIENPKTKAGRRTLEVEPTLIQALKAHQVAHKAAVLSGKAESSEWVFDSGNGQPIDYSGFHKRWDLAQSKVKVRQRRPHDLRHSWASWALSEGKPLLWVSKQLGHSSPMVTLKIYATWMPEEGTKNGLQIQENQTEKR
jgi:integrase